MWLIGLPLYGCAFANKTFADYSVMYECVFSGELPCTKGKKATIFDVMQQSRSVIMQVLPPIYLFLAYILGGCLFAISSHMSHFFLSVDFGVT